MAEAQAKKVVPIIHGRLPVALVFLIRFKQAAGTKVADLAAKFATTNGKIDDIVKNRNFAYVTAETRFTQAQIDEAKAHIEKHEDKDYAVEVVAELNALELATEAEAQAFADVRKRSGGQPSTNEAGEAIPAGGGNRRGGGKKAQKTDQKTADADAAANSDAPSADSLVEQGDQPGAAEPAGDAPSADELLSTDI